VTWDSVVAPAWSSSSAFLVAEKTKTRPRESPTVKYLVSLSVSSYGRRRSTPCGLERVHGPSERLGFLEVGCSARRSAAVVLAVRPLPHLLPRVARTTGDEDGERRENTLLFATARYPFRDRMRSRATVDIRELILAMRAWIEI
jgi:hypothetical protein